LRDGSSKSNENSELLVSGLAKSTKNSFFPVGAKVGYQVGIPSRPVPGMAEPSALANSPPVPLPLVTTYLPLGLMPAKCHARRAAVVAGASD